MKIKDFNDFPKTFQGQIVVIVGTIQISPTGSYYEGNFIVVDQGGNSFPVDPWVPMDIAPSPPGVDPKRDPIMRDFLGKSFSLEGEIGFDPILSMNKKRDHYFLKMHSAKQMK